MSEQISEQEAYDELSLYTLSHGDSAFIHQHIVDAYAAQHADDNIKPIKTTFALIGLYLTLEKGFTGKQVQFAHMQLAKTKKEWPHFKQPQEKSELNVYDVLRAPPGLERDSMILKWCRSVWKTWGETHRQIADVVSVQLGI
jgi:hypothetical protein